MRAAISDRHITKHDSHARILRSVIRGRRSRGHATGGIWREGRVRAGIWIDECGVCGWLGGGAADGGIFGGEDWVGGGDMRDGDLVFGVCGALFLDDRGEEEDGGEE